MLKLGLLKNILGLAFIVSAPLAANAQVAPAPAVECISAKDVAAVVKNFPQYKKFNGAQFCDDKSRNFIALSTLNKLRTIRFENVMPLSKDDLFQKRFSFVNQWYSYFTTRIKNLVDSDGQGSCAGSEDVVAYVRTGPFKDTNMYVCPSFYDERIMLVEKVSILLHEARHEDGFPHMTCTHGERKGQLGACDRAITDKGSYAISVESLSQISKYAKGLNPAVRLYAAQGSVSYATVAFEITPKISASDYLLVKTANNQMMRVDLATSKVTVVNLQLDEGKLINKDDFTVVLPSDKSKNATILSSFKLEKYESASHTVDIYNGLAAIDKANWVDINYGNALSIIKKNEIEFICDTAKLDSHQTVALPAGLESAEMIFPFESTDVTHTQDYLMTTSGVILELSCDQNKQPQIKQSTLKLDRNYDRIYNVKGIVVGLANDGKLYQIANGQSQLLAATAHLILKDIVPRHSVLFFE